jgi:hypothetical protein
MVQMAHKVLLVMTVLLAQTVHQVRMAHKVLPVTTEHLVLTEQLVKMVHKVLSVQMVLKVPLV